MALTLKNHQKQLQQQTTRWVAVYLETHCNRLKKSVYHRRT